MRILFVNQYYAPDYAATAQQMSDLCEFLASSGHEVHVLAGTAFYDGRQLTLPQYEVLNGVHVHRVAMPHSRRERIRDRLMGYLGFYWRAFIRAHTVPRPDVVVTLTTPPLISLLGAWLKILLGTRFVYWVMDVYPDIAIRADVVAQLGPTRGLWSTLARFTYYCADRVIVLGRDMSEVLTAKQVDTRRIDVIRSWAIGEEIYKIEHDQNSFRDKHINPGDFVVMYSGNMGTCHLYKEIVDTAESLHSEPSIRFLFIGGGKLFPEVREALENEQPRVLFLPYQPRERLASSLSAADVHLISLNPIYDGLLVPSKVYGCMASGRPSIMIGSRKSEAARLILDHECGIVVPPDDGEALKDAILHLRDNPEVAERMGKNGREAFLQHYERQSGTSRFMEMLQQVVAEKGHRRVGPVAGSIGRIIFSPGGRPISSWAFGLRSREEDSYADLFGKKPVTLFLAVFVVAWSFWQFQTSGKIEAWEESFRDSKVMTVEEIVSVPDNSQALVQATTYVSQEIFPPNRPLLDDLLKRQLSLTPMESSTWLGIARQRIMEGKFAEAREALGYADRLNPAYPQERLDAVQHWALLGERGHALQIAEQIANLDYAGRLEAGDALVAAGFQPAEVFQDLNDAALPQVQQARLAARLMTNSEPMNQELYDLIPEEVFEEEEARAILITSLTDPVLYESARGLWSLESGTFSQESPLTINPELKNDPLKNDFYLGWQISQHANTYFPSWREPATANDRGILRLETPAHDPGGSIVLYRLLVPSGTVSREFSVDISLYPPDAIDCRLILYEPGITEHAGDLFRSARSEGRAVLSALLPGSSEPRVIEVAISRNRRAPAARGPVTVEMSGINISEVTE